MSSSVSFAPGAASGSGEHTPTSPKLAAFIEPVRRSLDGVRTALSHIHLPHLPRKSSEVGRKSQGAEKEGEETDPELDALRGFLGTWVLDRKESDSDDGLLKMQGVSMLHRMTAKRLTFYTAHTLSRHAGHILLSAHVTADIPFVDFIYENHLDGVEREGDMPSVGPVRQCRSLNPDGSITSHDVSTDAKNPWESTSRWSIDERGRFVKETEARKGKEVWKGRTVMVRK